MRSLASPALGLAQADPVGRSIASPGKALPIHECFQQPDPLPILGLPVPPDPSADLAQDMTGQVRHNNPWKNQEPRIVNDESQVAGSLAGTPSNPLVPHRALPGGRAENHAGDGTIVCIAHPILEVLPNSAAIPQVMVAIQTRFQLGPRWSAGSLADLVQPQRQQLPQGAFHRVFIQGRATPHSLPTGTGGRFSPSWRQTDPALLLQFEQQGSRRHVFELPIGRPPVPK